MDVIATTSTEQFAALTALGGGILMQGLIVFARMMGLVAFAPIFGSLNVPMVARVGLALAMTAIITPLVAADLPEIPSGMNFGLLLANQALIGVMLGLVGAFLFHAIESAGRIIDTQRGSNISDLLAPQSGERTSPAGQWLMQLAVVIFLVTGQHLLLLDGIINSFHVLPPELSLDWINADSVHHFAELTGQVLVIALKVSAPALITLLLTDVALGIINRGAPQVNVFMLSMPIKAFVGVLAMLTSLATLVYFLKTDAFPGLLGTDGTGGWLGEMLKHMRYGTGM